MNCGEKPLDSPAARLIAAPPPLPGIDGPEKVASEEVSELDRQIAEGFRLRREREFARRGGVV